MTSLGDCGICLDPVRPESQDVVRTDQCQRHYYHVECYVPWFRGHKECALCQTPAQSLVLHPFSRTPTPPANPQPEVMVIITDPTQCGKCREWEEEEKMIGCEECEEWFHFRCTELLHSGNEPSPDEDWYCEKCRVVWVGPRRRLRIRPSVVEPELDLDFDL